MNRNINFYGACIFILVILSACSTGKKESPTDLMSALKDKQSQNGKSDVALLMNKLVMAFADEWMASYQYWMAAKLVQGELRSQVVKELIEHYNDEMRHADMIAKRLIELNGDFRMFPQDWHKIGGCHYDSITESSVISVLKENIKGEQCAIDFYKILLEMVKGKDEKTYSIILEILNDEIKHKKDLQELHQALPILK